ncbi:MAG: hypothetical protein ACEY3A_02835 [Wolbachia sp.]
MISKDKTIESRDQQIGINALVYYEELKGSLSEEVEQGRKLKFDEKVQVQYIPLTGKRGQTKLFKAGNKKQHNIRAGANTNAKNRVTVQHDIGVVQSSCQNLGGGRDWVIINDEDQEISAIPRGSEVIPSKDPGLENEILANFPDGFDRSHTIELKEEDLYVIVPENLTFAEITNILNQGIKESNYEELDKVVQNIEDYEGQSVALDGGSYKNFCSKQLNLDLQNISNHQHIYSNILSQYNFDQVEVKCNYSVKELVLLAIAANDQLADRYQGVLFAEGNLNLLPLLVGDQKYIEAFIGKFHGVDGIYDKLKNQAIHLVELSKIGFFSAIALRKEHNLLDTVFVEYVLKDLEQVLKTSGPDSMYGVLETASLVQNEEFITIVLGAFERYINEPTKKASIEELLKKSFATLLETAISQEHVSVVEYLCKKCTENKGPVIQGIYKEAFADNRVIEQLNKQIIKKIISGGTNGSRKEKAEKIYALVLKAALDIGNVPFIEHLCKKCTKCSNDVIDYLNQKLKGNEFDNTYESTLIALSNIGNEDTIVTVLTHIQIYQNVPHNEQVIRQVIQNILKSATHYSMDQEDYSLVKKVCCLCTEIDAVNVIFQEECKNFKSSIEKRIEDLEKENRLLQSEVLREYNYSHFPDIINGVAQIVHTAYDAYTEDQKPSEYQENVCSILCLMHIRDILQFSIDVQEYHCYERQDLWNTMYQTPKTFIIRKRSDNVADKPATPVIKSNILPKNPEPKSTGSQQPQKNAVDKGKNIMYNRNALTKHLISNNDKEGEMDGRDQDTKIIEERLIGAIESIDVNQVKGLVEKDTNVTESILSEALKKANERIANLGKVSKKKQGQENRLTQIIKLLETKLKSIGGAAPSSTDGAATDSQTTPAAEPKESEEDQPGSPSLSPQSSISGHSSSSSSLVYVPTSGEGDTNSSNGRYVEVSPLPGSGSGSPFENIGSVPTSERNSPQQPVVTANIGDSQQPKTLAVNSKSSSMSVEGGTAVPLVDGNKEKQTSPIGNAAQMDDDYGLSLLFSEEDDNNRQEDPYPTPEPAPAPTLSSTSKKPEQVNNTTPQNTKSSNLHTIAASILAIAGVALGVTIAVDLEMLAVGIVVGVCCLVAAAVMHHYEWPSSFIETNKVEKVASNEKKEPVATSV